MSQEGRYRAAPATQTANLKCFHLSAERSYTILSPSFLTLSPYRCSSQAQEARHLAALRHRVPCFCVRADHQGNQRADRVWRLPKVRITASLPFGGSPSHDDTRALSQSPLVTTTEKSHLPLCCMAATTPAVWAQS